MVKDALTKGAIAVVGGQQLSIDDTRSSGPNMVRHILLTGCAMDRMSALKRYAPLHIMIDYVMIYIYSILLFARGMLQCVMLASKG